MIADVIEYTAQEGGEWLEWPLPSSIKPSNPLLLTYPSSDYLYFPYNYPDKRRNYLKIHALKLSDGAEWDSINGFRDEKDFGPH